MNRTLGMLLVISKLIGENYMELDGWLEDLPLPEIEKHNYQRKKHVPRNQYCDRRQEIKNMAFHRRRM